MQLGFPWYYKYLSCIFIPGHSSSPDTICLFSLLHTNFLLPEKPWNLFLILELLLFSSILSYQSFQVLCSLWYDNDFKPSEWHSWGTSELLPLHSAINSINCGGRHRPPLWCHKQGTKFSTPSSERKAMGCL